MAVSVSSGSLIMEGPAFVLPLRSEGDMDLSVLPNNNHPDKFLQLDVKSLMRSPALLQASLARFPGGHYPAAQHWQNLVYSQREKKSLVAQGTKGSSREDLVTPDSPPPSLTSVMKNNPLYSDLSLEEAMEDRKKNPSWTIEEYDRHSSHTNLSGHLKENPNDLRFWLGDMYTPGFDTLLKKKKKHNKRAKLCHMGLILLVVASILVAIVTISSFFA